MSKFKLLHPRYWPLWLVLSIFWCIAKLPRSCQLPIGRRLGRLIVVLSKKVRHVMSANLRACFPLLDDTERALAERESAEELGVSIVETFWVWFNRVDRILGEHFSIEGYEHLNDAIRCEKGVIILACHFGSVDLNAALLSMQDRKGVEFLGTFRQTDGVINLLLRKFRLAFVDRMVSAGDQRSMVRALRKKGIVWYAPDIEVKNKASAFVDFMGVKASTTLAVSRLAKATGAVVIPFGHYRLSDNMDYKATFFPALTNFPSDDLVLDARGINESIEKLISPHPYRYWWAIKRFKNRPDGEAKIY